MPEYEGEVHPESADELLLQAQADGNASFLRAARAGNLEKVLEYLKGSIDINTSNANGLNALHLASKEGHVNVVTELLKRGANVDAATKKGNTGLHIASLAGQEEIVKILVQHEASVNVQSQNGFTPLYMAAQENHDNVVRFLLAHGANQSLATEDGFTPLAVALQQGHDKVVAVLLENDTRGKVRLPALHIAAKKDDCKAAVLLLQNDHNPDVTSKSGFTPLHIAAHYGNESIAAILLQRGADVNYTAKHNITPLHVSSKWGKTNMVTLLLEKNANIDAKTRDGLTPLHCAARSGHDQVVDLLSDKGAFMTAKTKNGLAPLHMAAQGDHVDSARIILFHKAPVDDVTMDYLTALHVAAHCGHVRVAKLLLDRKADPNARALNGFTPLHIACKKNRIKVVELLLKHGASIEATTESGLTPLHVASFMGCMNIVIYLIQHGSNPDVPTVRGETPLHLAARANQIDIIRILLRNGAHVDARAREQQTPLHIAARLGNSDIVALLLQHGADVDATTKDMYTALHIASKEEQDDVASVLLEQGASLTSTTKKGFTPLHLAAKYGNMKVARLLLQREAPVDAQGKNGVTPLHVAAHYDHQNVALLLLDKGASPHATAKNGYSPLHIAAKKNQMDIATTLLEYGAKASSESKAGFTPLHLAAQEGHTDMCTLLLEHHADPNSKAKNGLTPLHLCAQEDRVNVAAILVKSEVETDTKTKAGYTPLHVACHFGQINMVRFLLQHGVDVNSITSLGYTPLHQAAQQGHSVIINLLLEHRASPNAVTNHGQTALSIAQRLGYISVVETLKVVTETTITTTIITTTEEKYKVVAPETMQETFMSDSEDEGVGEDTMLGDQSYHYLTVDEMKSLGDDSCAIDPTRDERIETHIMKDSMSAPPTAEEDQLSPQHIQPVQGYAQFTGNYVPDNIDISRSPIQAGQNPSPLLWASDQRLDQISPAISQAISVESTTDRHTLATSEGSHALVGRFLVSFMVDARGGAMRGCRHSGVRVIIPPRKAAMPMRITCRYLKKEKLSHPPPLMEGEACASRILEMGPSGAKFLGPVIIEVPHFAALRGKEREITIMRSDNGETWREHTLEATEEAVQDVLNESFDGEELSALDDLNTSRITRILTTDFPQYFAIVSRVRQEVHAIGPEGGMVSSTVVPQVQAVFPEGALTKKIKVGLQAQPIPSELVAKMLGNRVAVSPIVTVEPRRRKFHKPIVLTIPIPQAASKGMINQYAGDAPTLRLLCSITGGTSRAQWEDVTGSTPLTFVNDCVSFTTTVSARFWLMDCRNISEATKMATDLYREAIHVPFMAKFVVFGKRHDPQEARLRVFCMTDDKEEKTLENQEHFVEVAKSRDVEVLETKTQFVEFAGNLVPVTKSGEQLCLEFYAFKENRLPFIVRVRDPHQDPAGRIAFMREAKVSRGEPPQTPICNLNIALPDIIKMDSSPDVDLLSIETKYDYLTDVGLNKEAIHRAELRLSDIANLLGSDWTMLALQLDIAESDINVIKSEYQDDELKQAIYMLRLWVQCSGNKATGNTLEKALRKINREDIVNQCIFNVELVTDDVEKAVAKVHLDQSGFDTLKEELGPSREASLRRDTSLDASYDEQDIMKEAESAEETNSETGSIPDRRLSSGPYGIESGDELDAARLAESETWTSQELDLSTPDLLQAGPDVLSHGASDEDGKYWREEEEERQRQVVDDDGGHWSVPTQEIVHKDDTSRVAKKITTLEYTSTDGQEQVKALSATVDEGKEAPAHAEPKITSSSPGEDKDEGVIEETIPFHQKKDFFQKLASSSQESNGGGISPPRKTSPPLEDKQSPATPVTPPFRDEQPDEDVIPFSERLSGFRKLEESVQQAQDFQERRSSKTDTTITRKLLVNEKSDQSMTVTRSSPSPPPALTQPQSRLPPPDLVDFPPATAAVASKEARVLENEQRSRAVAAASSGISLVSGSHVDLNRDDCQRQFEGSLALTSQMDPSRDDFSITTPDLETPIEGPEAASKSNNQKMIEVTERVAEVASTLASTLERAEKSSGSGSPALDRKVQIGPGTKKGGATSSPRKEKERLEDLVISNQLVTSIENMVLEEEAKAASTQKVDEPVALCQDKAIIVEQSPREVSPIKDTVAPKVVDHLQKLGDAEKPGDKHESRKDESKGDEDDKQKFTEKSQEAEKPKDFSQNIDVEMPKPLAVSKESKDSIDSDQQKKGDKSDDKDDHSKKDKKPTEPDPHQVEKGAVSISSSDGDGRPVKAECKLLVKTSEMGKDAIEIRSIKEFVETGARQSELSRIFSEAAASTVPMTVTKTGATSDLTDKEESTLLDSRLMAQVLPPTEPQFTSQPHLASLSVAYEEPPHYEHEEVDPASKLDTTVTTQLSTDEISGLVHHSPGNVPELYYERVPITEGELSEDKSAPQSPKDVIHDTIVDATIESNKLVDDDIAPVKDAPQAPSPLPPVDVGSYSVTDVTDDPGVADQLSPEIGSTGIVTTPSSERRRFPTAAVSGTAKTAASSPPDIVVMQENATDDPADTSRPVGTPEGLVTEPGEDDLLVDRRHSAPEVRHADASETSGQITSKDAQEQGEWEPEKRAEFYAEGDFEDEEFEPRTSSRIVTTHVTRTIRGPDGQEVVETEDYEGPPADDQQLRQSVQDVLDRFLQEDDAATPDVVTQTKPQTDK